MKPTIYSRLRFLAAISLLAAGIPSASAQNTNRTEWHNEASDTTRITHILIEEAAHPSSRGDMARIGTLFAGTPYAAHTLEGETEALRVNLDSLDCTTFVETVAALASIELSNLLDEIFAP